jgi:2-haloacid dehalogenase
MGIKTIFFDADGTLLDFRKAENKALTGLKDFMGSDLSQEDFIKTYHKINDRIWMELEEGSITAAELKQERFHRFAAAMKSKVSARELSEFYLRALGQGCFYLKDAQNLLKALQEDFPMAMITNGLTAVQEARFEALGFYDLFTEILISETEGIAKPDPEIFKRAAQRMGVPLNKEILMVGDSLSSDIAGGIAAGISTCWYSPGVWENHSSHKADYEIQSLMEILEIL